MSEQVTTKRAKGVPLSAGMVLVTLGVVYGDIGTSPMYTLKAITSGNGGLATMSEDVVLGALSLIIWTITLITTVKYVLIAMKADNAGEGGIFALYSLVRRCGKWLIVPAMVGGAALLADGILTPAVTVTTAIEGLRSIDAVYAVIGDDQNVVVVATIAIISLLFLVQRAGTSTIGKLFGPVMCVWFVFLGAAGVWNMGADLSVLRALNPVRGIAFLFDGSLNAAGLMILGNVFLCTTGAEALYSDMGHVGKANVYASWPLVKVCLILNYLGQGAWIIRNHTDATLAATSGLNPFFQMLPASLRAFAVVLSTFAAIIASQALITGSFSIISEAIHLDLMPHMQVRYPSETKGQLYIPLVNHVMWVACVCVVLLFQTSEHMEAAYGLAITVTMLMTTLLLCTYLSRIRGRVPAAVVFTAFFGLLEFMFFLSSLTKFLHGGYFTVLMAFAIFSVMYVWRRGTALERKQSIYLPVREYLDQIFDLRGDEAIPYLADNLVFLTNDSSFDMLDRDILYSILDKRPKRARAYWFVNVRVTDEPKTHEFTVNTFDTDFVFKVQLRLGFHESQRINEYLYQVVDHLVRTGQIAPQHHRYSIYKDAGDVGDFRFCMIRKVPSAVNDISNWDLDVLTAKYAIRRIAGSPATWYGLDTSTVIFETVPLFSGRKRVDRLTYVELPAGASTAWTHVRPASEQEPEDADVEAERTAAADAYIGGATASFRPVLADDQDSEDSDDE